MPARHRHHVACDDALNSVSTYVVDRLHDATGMAIRRDVNRAIATFPDLGVHEDAEIRKKLVKLDDRLPCPRERQP